MSAVSIETQTKLAQCSWEINSRWGQELTPSQAVRMPSLDHSFSTQGWWSLKDLPEKIIGAVNLMLEQVSEPSEARDIS